MTKVNSSQPGKALSVRTSVFNAQGKAIGSTTTTNKSYVKGETAKFINKLNIALKEANETEYWLELLIRTEYITREQYESINNDSTEINKLLISIIKTTKNH